MGALRTWILAGIGGLVGACGASAPPTDDPLGQEARRPPEVHAETPDGEVVDAPPRTALARALEARLTVWVKRDGTRVFARHCRQGPVDCELRIATLASLLEDAAERHGLDPFLLAAIAVRESALDPSAVGAAGEAGIIQLHPRGVGRNARYVLDAGFREDCQSRVDACQWEVLETGARALADSIERCGSLEGGIGRYASGQCAEDYRYVGRVFAERDRLRELSED